MGAKPLGQSQCGMCAKTWDESCLILGWGIKMFPCGLLNGLWVNQSSSVCKEGWAPLKVSSGFHVLLVWVLSPFFFFLANTAKLFPAWAADFIGKFLINVKAEICWEYSIKINKIKKKEKKKSCMCSIEHSVCVLWLTGRCESPWLGWLPSWYAWYELTCFLYLLPFHFVIANKA